MEIKMLKELDSYLVKEIVKIKIVYLEIMILKNVVMSL